MDFHELLNRYFPQVRKHWLPLSLGIFGLILFSYGLISLFASAKTASEDVSFEAGADSLGAQTASGSGTNSKNLEMVVDVEGAVLSPGVYSLPLGTRIKDALIAAGGLSSVADRDWIAKNLDLAAKLSDGAKIYFPKTGENVQSLGSVSNDGKININSASKEELDSLPGVGPATAEKIVNARPYSDINELLSKKAVGSKVFEQIKEKIAVY